MDPIFQDDIVFNRAVCVGDCVRHRRRRSDATRIPSAEVAVVIRSMPLVRVPEAFNHTDWIYELKYTTASARSSNRPLRRDDLRIAKRG